MTMNHCLLLGKKNYNLLLETYVAVVIFDICFHLSSDIFMKMENLGHY